MNSIVIEYEDKEFLKQSPKKAVSDFLKKILKFQNLNNVEFSVTFVDEKRMHDLNFEYRNIDDSTDILSFAAEDETDVDFVMPKGFKRSLGDIIICADVLKRNAKTFEVSEDEELKRLLIHGVLHLSGYNHQTNDSSEPMLVLQEEILKSLTGL